MIKNRRGIWKLPGQAVSNCSSNFHHAFWESKNKRFFDETRFLILDSCRAGPYYLASGLKATIHLPCHAGEETLQTPPLVNMLHSMLLANEDLSYFFISRRHSDVRPMLQNKKLRANATVTLGGGPNTHSKTSTWKKVANQDRNAKSKGTAEIKNPCTTQGEKTFAHQCFKRSPRLRFNSCILSMNSPQQSLSTS